MEYVIHYYNTYFMGCCIQKYNPGRKLINSDTSTFITLPSSYYCEDTFNTSLTHTMYITCVATPSPTYTVKSPADIYSSSA